MLSDTTLLHVFLSFRSRLQSMQFAIHNLLDVIQDLVVAQGTPNTGEFFSPLQSMRPSSSSIMVTV